MNNFLYAMIAAGAIALAVWLFLVWRGLTQDWMPAELKAGKVALIERNLTADLPTGCAVDASDVDTLVGRPDLVIRIQQGLHVPVENKNRNSFAVFETDVAQLSLQAWLLRQNGMKTTTYGYVAVNNRRTGERRAVRVELRDDEYCLLLVARYIDLSSGRLVPRKSRGRKCESCGHRQRCERDAA
ncbi:hypothetical protein WS86_00190 (plasmid) [Burkholderia savannae]|uniref:PD-(D/E)XK endonuclease-like domain-containing protein n=1 Tax=Burkholderia savannae TaxID=1637837 RepID=A0ABR5T8T9_9BURK|nr:PD-(D/E)XK nuclease family protein [Burkholderia savannae]AOJ79197.1 hypothetical protein WS86_00190 [Burkholderia savannae]KWZ39530.1 hypothetical protein WS72_19150 [Burkholderia savannae]